MTTTRELLLHAWTWRPVVVGALAAAIGLHLGLLRLRHPARTLALLGAVAVVVLALLSPIEALARGTLFSAHMLQHLLLVLGAPPLALLALPRRSRQPPRRRAPAFAYWALGVGAMWIWHAPTLCNAAATSEPVRTAQTLSLLAMGTAFWWPILGPRLEQRLSDPAAVAYLFTACVACSLLGITIAFAPLEVCSAYLQPADPLGVLPLVRDRWGLTAAVDQQLGGLLMWVPGCAVYGTAIIGVLARFYGGGARVSTAGAP